ncbi:DUF397 domain-containing protein [Embleya scabrispora]|uniref:DUF397 domain-containing protein n=1 Tax=Embleya scabrispora TaxID=159449 RepID=A0A1T3NNF1_9ACTN|nr:DUF397 domain-containing protein [Embleya scabrispora]OPC78417.1 DUF397 domain-containing protein [Embleya scabrispora]
MSTDVKAVTWRRSSFSNGTGGNCVEVSGDVPAIVPVRDSKNVRIGHLIFGAASWTALTASLRS